MNRYISSFIISSIVYGLALASIIYLLSEKAANASEPPKKSIQSMKFTIINPEVEKKVVEPKLEPKPINKPKPKPKPKPKIKPKPVPKPKPKPISKPEPRPTPEPESKAEEETIKPMAQPVSANINSKKENDDERLLSKELKKAKQNLFISNLRKLIDQNKSYPNSARRRSVEGSVEVKFDILASGQVGDIKVVSGKSIFKRSAIQAIERSFPISIDKELFSFPKEFKVTLIYTLKS